MKFCVGICSVIIQGVKFRGNKSKNILAGSGAYAPCMVYSKFTHNLSLKEDAKSLVNGRFSKIQRQHLKVQALSYRSLAYLVSIVFT